MIPNARQEARLAGKHVCVSVLGFLTDAAVLRGGLWAGLEPAWARVISLTCAMHVTFFVNGLLVFRCLERRTLARHWLGYMATNALGGLCNYFIFVAFVSTHWRVISAPFTALAAASLCAWAINYASARLLVFGAPAPPPASRSSRSRPPV